MAQGHALEAGAGRALGEEGGHLTIEREAAVGDRGADQHGDDGAGDVPDLVRLVRAVGPAVGLEHQLPVTDEDHAVVELAPDGRLVQALGQLDRANRWRLLHVVGAQRVPIELAYFEGLTQQEIAGRLDQPLGTIKTRMRLGMQKLKGLLEEQR